MKRFEKGFTLIELLIVIAVIGILAVAVLSAINPLEQMRKGRDTARKSDASELLNAIERFYTSYQCYPWSYGATGCTSPLTPITLAANPVFTAGGNVEDLITVNELKLQYADRIAATGNPSYQKLWMIEVGGTDVNSGQVSVCFEPESTAGRTGGMGRTQTGIGSGTFPGTCGGAYAGGGSVGACWICLPQ